MRVFAVLSLLPLFSVVSCETAVAYESLESSAKQMWQSLLSAAEEIDSHDCFVEVKQTLEESHQLLTCSGVSQQFLDFLPNVKTVAGDLPDTQQLLDRYSKVEEMFAELYTSANRNTSSKVEVEDKSEAGSMEIIKKSAIVALVAACLLL